MRYLYLLFLGLVPFLSLSQVDYNSESFETAGDLGIWNAGSGSSSVIQSTSTAYNGDGGSRSIYLGGTYSYIITEVLDLSGVTQVDFSFYYRTSASNKFKNGDALVVESNTGTGWIREATYNSPRTSFTSSGTISITPSAGSTFSSTTQFSIDLITGNPGPDFAYIDLIDIKVYATPPDAPNEIIVYNINPTSFNISWDAVSNATSYKVYQGGALVNTTSSNTTSFSSLSPNTSYNIEVESLNSYNIPSASKASKSVTTSKASIGGARFEGGTLTVGAGTAFKTTNMSVDGTDIEINSNPSSSGMLLATGTVTTTYSNAFTYNRNLPDTDWYIISSPVENYSTTNYVGDNSLKESGIKRALGEYRPGNSPGNRWNYYTSNGDGSVNGNSFDNYLIPAKGYSTSLTQSGEITFKGDFVTLTDGKVTIDKSSPNNSHLWYAVGNPFMTFYKANNFITDNSSNFKENYGGIYIWDGDTNKYEPYAADDNFLIAPGQGFLIKLGSNSTQSIVFDKSHQTTDEGLFYQNDDNRSNIIIYMSNQDRVAKTKVYYTAYGSKDLDSGYDLGAFKTSSFDINSKLVALDLEDVNYQRQTLSDTSFEDQVVPLSISSKNRQMVEFRIDYANIPDHLEIYLEDRLASQFYNLKENRAQIVVNAGANSHGRFFLHTKPLKFWIEDNSEDDTQDDSVFDLADGIATKAFDFFNLKDNILHFEGVNSKEQVRVNLFNLNGNKVFSTAEDLESSNNTIQLPYTLSEGVYIVELYRASGQKMTKKIIVR